MKAHEMLELEIEKGDTPAATKSKMCERMIKWKTKIKHGMKIKTKIKHRIEIKMINLK